MTKTALSRRAPWLAALAFITFGAPTQAAVFCVNSAGTLQTALSTAASNGVDDEIRIVQGTYVGNFVYTSTQAKLPLPWREGDQKGDAKSRQTGRTRLLSSTFFRVSPHD